MLRLPVWEQLMPLSLPFRDLPSFDKNSLKSFDQPSGVENGHSGTSSLLNIAEKL